MPYVWDGQDNATRVNETRHGIKMHRSNWKEEELLNNIKETISNTEISRNLSKSAKLMQSDDGTVKAASLILNLAK